MGYSLLIPNKDDDYNSNDLPLVNQYVKERKRNGDDIDGVFIDIRRMKLSSSGEWIILSTDVCCGLVNSESELGFSLIELIKNLRGEGRVLGIVPTKKSKLGFVVGVDDERIGMYSYNKEESHLHMGYNNTGDNPKYLNPLALDIIKITSPTKSVDGEADASEPDTPTKGRKRATFRVTTPTTNGKGV